jgi:hypothetical protein
MAAYHIRAPDSGFATRVSLGIAQALAIFWALLAVGFLLLIGAGFLVAGLRL